MDDLQLGYWILFIVSAGLLIGGLAEVVYIYRRSRSK